MKVAEGGGVGGGGMDCVQCCKCRQFNGKCWAGGKLVLIYITRNQHQSRAPSALRVILLKSQKYTNSSKVP